MTLEEYLKEARQNTGELEMPESIRTPGRTWTRYSEVETGIEEKTGTSEEPEIKVEGEAEVYTGEEAFEKSGESFFGLIDPDENRLHGIHTTSLDHLIYIEVSGQAEIKIVYRSEKAVSAHMVVETKRNSELDIREEFRGRGKLQTSFNELYLGENSTVNFGAIEAYNGDLSYTERRAKLQRDSEIKWLNAQFRGELNRTNIRTILEGENSSTEKTGVWYPVDQEHFDLSLEVFHRGKNTACDMDSRAVVDDKARSVYEGLQQVRRDAKSTRSFQDQETLMLSDNAEDDASPKLMIENPDVEASHAASTGGVPRDELHYMESRGIPEDKARKLVVKGYFEPVMEDLPLPGMKQGIRKEVKKKLES